MSKSIIQRFLAIFGSNVITILVSLSATPIIVRILGSQQYGEYAFMLSIMSILLLIVNGGIYDAIRKYLKETDRPQTWSDHVFSFYTRIGVILAVTILCSVLIVVECGIVRRYLDKQFEVYFILIALTVISRQAFGTARSTLMGFDREDISEKLMIFNKISEVLSGLLLILFGYGVSGLISGIIIANTLTSVVGFVLIARFIDYTYIFSSTPDGFPRSKLLKFNLLSVVLFALFISIKHFDILLIQYFRGSSSTGYYKAALNLAEFVWFVPRIVQTTLLHSTSEMWSEGKQEAITEISSKVTRYSLLFTLLLIIGLGSLAEPTVLLYYGPEFESAVLPLMILLPGAMGFAVARPILAIGQGKGNFRYLIYATGSASIINFLLNIVLIPRFGIVGAAIATSVGYFSMLVFHVISARAIGFNPTADLRLSRIAVTIIIATAVIGSLSTAINSLPLLFIVIPTTGFLIYTIVAISTGAISKDEIKELQNRVSS